MNLAREAINDAMKDWERSRASRVFLFMRCAARRRLRCWNFPDLELEELSTRA